MSDLSHLDNQGRARMVDVGGKTVTDRWAKARAEVRVSPELYAKLESNSLEKGDAVSVARIAGIQAAKRAAELIPLCHPITLTHIDVEILFQAPDRVIIASQVRASALTGAEMEALTAASVAALTIYDMGKAIDRGIVIEKVELLEKGGGKSGLWQRKEDA
ncbi:cyclic pyranopterin monophosphate synthase MoaC [bacterium]|nr:cyclic pyranopterin monophosphate synthase MoaC [bacterium]MBU1651215.1 cyclic pyranopterin monophosphate synthase MoaC [bacterium]MBU1882129.1 cyclic pyranopterin monophosphate synthase MoaC [bacterium]